MTLRGVVITSILILYSCQPVKLKQIPHFARNHLASHPVNKTLYYVFSSCGFYGI